MRTTDAIIVTMVIIGTILSSDLLAQQDSTGQNIFELSLNELMNVVVTPSKLPQFAGTVTQKIDVIDANEIATIVSGNRNVCELIGQLPGASVSVLSRNDANWGTYGGIGPKYSTYMLQGVPLDAFVDPMSLDPNILDHIEVQRGPASVFYPNYLSQDFAGNQSPLAGTINLILKGKVEKPKTTLQTSFGSYNTLNSQFFHEQNVGLLNYFLGSTYEMSDYTDYGSQGSWLNMKKDPGYSKTKLYGGLTLFIDEEEQQKFTLFCQETWHSGDIGRIYQGFDHQYQTINTGYDIAFNDRLSLQSHFGLRSYDRSWQSSNYGAIDTLTANNGVKQLIIPIDISFSWRHGEANLLSIGGDYQGAKYQTWVDPLAGYRTYGNKASAFQGGIYAEEQWRPDTQLTLRGGLRFSHIKNTIELVNANAPGINADSWDKLLWSIGLRYSFSKTVAIYANTGSSFATPALKSTGGTIPLSDFGVIGRDGQLPNPGLKPESGTSIDGGSDLRLPYSISAGVRVFYTIIRDAIVDNVVSLNPSQSQSINTGNSRSVGGEIEISQRISDRLSWFANGTYMKTSIKNEIDADQNDTEIPFSPNLVGNLGMHLHSSTGFSFTTSLNYNGGFYDGTSKSGRHRFKPGILLNAYLAQQLAKAESYSVEGFAQFYNITNNKYEMPWQFENPGFSCMVGIKVSFQ